MGAARAAVGDAVSGWIIVDTKATNAEDEVAFLDARYLGRHGWRSTIREAGAFPTREAAEDEARSEDLLIEPNIRIRRVRPAGAKRDTTAALRAELDGLRTTDSEMASRVALAEQRAAGWAASYQSATDREARVRVTLGAVQGEATDEVVKRVVAERDDAVRELAGVRQQLAALYDTLAAAKAALART